MLFRRELVFAVALVLALVLVTVFGALADDYEEYYVKTNGQDIGSYNGKSWTEAWKTIKYALDRPEVVSGDVIHLQAGTYIPSPTGETFPISIDSSHGGITLKGAGMGMTILDAKGTKAIPTTRVMNIEGVSNFTLEGLTIRGGSVTSSSSSNYDANVEVANGGGIYCYLATNLLIKDCEITDNYAKGTFASRDGDGDYDWSGQYGDGTWESARAGGGGIYLRQCKDGNEPTVTIENCLIHDNETGMGGGGICSNYGPAIIKHCCIHSNKACQGGGVYWFDYVDESNHPRIEHILFNDLIVLNEIRSRAYSGDESWTDDQGGGIYMSSWGLYQKFRVYNVTVADNAGYEVYMSHNCKNIDIEGANNIFWPDDDDKGFYDDGFNGTCKIHHSDIWYGNGTSAYPGTGNNIVVDPNFQKRSTIVTEGYFLDQNVSPGPVNLGDNTAYYASSLVNSVYSTDKRDSADYKDLGVVDMGFHYGFHSVSYVELVSFTATALPAKIVLQWETGAEIDNAGFLLYRSEAGGKSYRCISGLIAAQGSASSGASYAFVDEDVSGTVYNYYLVDIDTSGEWTAHGPRASAPISVSNIGRPWSARTPGELASDEVVRVNAAHRQSSSR
ncbi:MAG TPA: right-handed parallel beta-helix repeat-containing protein [bacterium]|nr:right-handed parallel beta-helix repeat-containing protein [bacterium]